MSNSSEFWDPINDSINACNLKHACISFIGHPCGKSTSIGNLIKRYNDFDEKQWEILSLIASNSEVDKCPSSYYAYRKHKQLTKKYNSIKVAATTQAQVEQLSLGDAKFYFADTPSNIKYKGFVRGLFQSTHSILFVDAISCQRQLESNTPDVYQVINKNLVYMISNFGLLKKVNAIVINRMDKIPGDKQKSAFESIRKWIIEELTFNVTDSSGLHISSRKLPLETPVIPLSSLYEVNLFPGEKKFDWFTGMSLVDMIKQLVSDHNQNMLESLNIDKRSLPSVIITTKYRYPIHCGLVTSGTINVGDTMYYGRSLARIYSIHIANVPVKMAVAGEYVGLSLSIELRAGSILTHSNSTNRSYLLLVNAIDTIERCEMSMLSCNRVNLKQNGTIKATVNKNKLSNAPLTSGGSYPIQPNTASIIIVDTETHIGVMPSFLGKGVLVKGHKIVGYARVLSTTAPYNFSEDLNQIDKVTKYSTLKLALRFLLTTMMESCRLINNEIEVKVSYYLYNSLAQKTFTATADKPYLLNIITKNDSSPIVYALEKKNSVLSRKLLAEGADISIMPSLLHLSIEARDKELFDLLISHGAAVNGIRGKDGSAPLSIVLNKLRSDPDYQQLYMYFLDELIKNGADPRRGKRRLSGYGTLVSPIEEAAWRCNLEVLDILLNACPVKPESINAPSTLPIDNLIYLNIQDITTTFSLPKQLQSIFTVPNISNIVPPLPRPKGIDDSLGKVINLKVNNTSYLVYQTVLLLKGFTHPLFNENVNELELLTEETPFSFFLDFLHEGNLQKWEQLKEEDRIELGVKILSIIENFAPQQRSKAQDLLTKTSQSIKMSTRFSELSELLKKQSGTDFFILSNEEPDKPPIKCHKLVLACRSQYFASIFQGGFKESNENSAGLDIPHNLLQHILEFIYTGDTTINGDNCMSLLIASIKYDLTTLSVLVQNTIKRNLDVDNVCQIIRYADAHNATYLYQIALVYVAIFANHIKDWKVQLTNKEQELVQDYIELLPRKSLVAM